MVVGPGVDYYDDLGLTRVASTTDIKRAYRKLSLKYHPDQDASPEASVAWMRVSEAYDVLSQPKLKGFFDLYGEEGLKDGVSDGRGGVKGGFYTFSRDPIAIFEEFFGTKNPFTALNNIQGAFQALTMKPELKPGKQKTYELPLTLEEIYFGCVKKVEFTRKTLVTPGSVPEIAETPVEFAVYVKPGTPDKTRFVFDESANVTPTTKQGPVVYVVKQLKHEKFQRRGADLIYPVSIPIHEALIGTTLTITKIDGTTLTIPFTKIIEPGTTKTIKGEGLPVMDTSADSGAVATPEEALARGRAAAAGPRGDMHIVFDIFFPTQLTETQKLLLKSAFYAPPKPIPEQDAAIKAYLHAYKDEVKGWANAYPSEK